MKAGKERKGGTEKGEGSKAKRDKDARGGGLFSGLDTV